MVSSPDFGIHVSKHFDEIRKAEEIGTLVIDMMKKIQAEVSKNQKTGITLPEPISLSDLSPKNDPARLSISDVARILETSQDTVRRLVEDGTLKCTTTRGGHRRFRASAVEAYRNLCPEIRIRSEFKPEDFVPKPSQLSLGQELPTSPSKVSAADPARLQNPPALTRSRVLFEPWID